MMQDKDNAKIDVKFSLDMKTLYIVNFENDTVYEYHLERLFDVLSWNDLPPIVRVGKIKLADSHVARITGICKSCNWRVAPTAVDDTDTKTIEPINRIKFKPHEFECPLCKSRKGFDYLEETK